MRVTVCQLPHEPHLLDRAWAELCEHTHANSPELVLLPEFAMLEPVWESETFDSQRWQDVERQSASQLCRLPDLKAGYVIGTRPATTNGLRRNQAYLWSAAAEVRALRSKYFLPQEAGGWEASWFARGDPTFPVFQAGDVKIGVNICTELWVLETYASYAASGVELVVTPRATAFATREKWLAAGVVAAVRSGAFSISSNRVDRSGACGGGGWIVDPDGEVMAFTSAAEPFATCDLDLAQAVAAKATYPRYVFA